MRLKYQLRGLGIGIILTAALLMIFSDDGEATAKVEDMSVIAEETVETQSVSESEMQAVVETEESVAEETVVETQEPVEEETVVETQEPVTEETVVETQEPVTEETVVEETAVETETTKEASTDETTEESVVETTEEVSLGNVDVVKIKIISGDDSGTVARRLQTAGVVENASEFDAFLMQHGYDKRISVGEVEIAKGSTWLEIAEKISGRN